MAKVFRPSTREASLLSKIESSKEQARRKAIMGVRDNLETLSNAVAIKLVEQDLVETHNKNGLQEQVQKALERLAHAEDFDVDYQVAPFRSVVPHPNIVSLYLTAFVIEKLINHKDVVDIYGSDEEIYSCIHRQVTRYVATT